VLCQHTKLFNSNFTYVIQSINQSHLFINTDYNMTEIWRFYVLFGLRIQFILRLINYKLQLSQINSRSDPSRPYCRTRNWTLSVINWRRPSVELC